MIRSTFEFFDEHLLEIRTFIDNGTFLQEIAAKLTPFGFGTRGMLKGRQLLNAAHAENEFYLRYNKSSQRLYDQFFSKYKNIYVEYESHKYQAKLILDKTEKYQELLDNIDGKNPAKYSQWLKCAMNFYSHCLTDSKLQQKFSEQGIALASLKNVSKDIDYLEVLRLKQEYDSKTAAYHLTLRELKYEDLKEWYTEAQDIARIALADSPHLLNSLIVNRKVKNKQCEPEVRFNNPIISDLNV